MYKNLRIINRGGEHFIGEGQYDSQGNLERYRTLHEDSIGNTVEEVLDNLKGLVQDVEQHYEKEVIVLAD